MTIATVGDLSDIIEAILEAEYANRPEPPEIEFINGPYRESFAKQNADALGFLTTDNEGRQYRLVKMVFEEQTNG